MGIVGRWIDSLPVEGVERDAIITHPDPTFDGIVYWSEERDCGCLVGDVVDALARTDDVCRGYPMHAAICGVWTDSQHREATLAGGRFPVLARRFTPERTWRVVKARAAKNHRPLNRLEVFVALDFPSWLTWGRRAGARIPHGRPRGANGRLVCRWCREECRGRRTSWCSDECARRFSRVWSWGAVSNYVKHRDGGRCQRCGTTEPPKPKNEWRYDPWDVDHIVPVVDGGTDDPANLRLLCSPCHVAVGYEQRRARAERSQPSLPLEAS